MSENQYQVSKSERLLRDKEINYIVNLKFYREKNISLTNRFRGWKRGIPYAPDEIEKNTHNA